MNASNAIGTKTLHMQALNKFTGVLEHELFIFLDNSISLGHIAQIWKKLW